MDFIKKILFGEQSTNQDNQSYHGAIYKLQQNHLRISRGRATPRPTNINALQMPMILEEKQSNYQSDYNSTGKKMTPGSIITRQEQLTKNMLQTASPVMRSQQEITSRMVVSKPSTSPASLSHSQPPPRPAQAAGPNRIGGSVVNNPMPMGAPVTPFNINYNPYMSANQPEPGCCPCYNQMPGTTPYGHHW